MKKLIIPIALIAAATVSCSRNQIEIDPVPVEYMYTFAIEDGETRVADETRALLDNKGVSWVAGDRVGMFLEGYTGYANVNASATPKTVTLYSKNEIPANSYAYAYYPYNSTNSNKASAVITLSNNQDGGAVSAMPMAGIPFLVQDAVALNGSSAQTSGVIKFLNLGAIIDFKVFSTNSAYASETVQYIEFNADGVSISGNATIDLSALTDGQFDDSALELNWGTGSYDFVKVSQTAPVASTKDAATSIYMVVGPGTYPSGTITVVTDAATYTFNYTNKELGRNSLKHFNMDLAHATRVAGATETVKTLPYSEEFTSNRGEFEIDGGTGSEWQFRTTYGATVTGYYGGSKHNVVTSLVSPWIDLRSVSNAKLSFSHAINKYLKGECSAAVKIMKEGDSAWTDLSVPFPSLPSGNYSDYLDVEVELYSYVGKKVKIKFEYTSTANDAGTWEIRNFSCVETAAPAPSLGWLEMPAYTVSDMNGTTSSNLNDLYKVTHKATMGGTLQRNYTVLYDPSMYASYWVAYPLCAAHIGSGRTDNPWDYDPDVPTGKQATVFPSSYGQYFWSASNSDNYYARGHQIPNADRNGCEEMRVQTFYMTNITPQVHYGLNEGTWMYLEGAVRDVIRNTADTVYVVTGAAFRKKGTSDTINTFYFNKNDDSKTIPIPNYYWKALLKVKWNGNNVTEAKAIGFWLPNEDLESVSYEGYVVNVNQIEQWTGFDLFANLPDSVEETAETNTRWDQFQSF